MATITSRQHPLVRAFRAAARGAADVALLDGWHLLHDAILAAVEITAVAVRDDALAASERALLARLPASVHVVHVSSAVMNALSPVRTPGGVAALARPRRCEVDALLAPPPPLVLCAEGVQDPGNAGAIVRAAEAAGGTGVFFTGASADPWGWKALRAAMGSTFRLPVRRESDTVAALEECRGREVRLLAAVPRGGRPMHLADLRGPVGLVLGGEGGGLPEAVLARVDEQITIPMHGAVESLNVAVAAALLVYEARRQRHDGEAQTLQSARE